eukprot:gnl/MRDRNA2_/MRDRNA2_65709_c0_seq1.p1 gnl/MRDRNA2_/MRDRNA2_65709_c0~~gnl/MRDRNA2_/MRDRNA2_65709_c0_seq1.p1  ORF type:complete len:122 (+),score=24.30 gnl/MRDRNA2_/MRDRNA2_65709_c0_seq1:345-710(+)
MTWALASAGLQSPRLMEKLGQTARQVIEQFTTQQLLRFFLAYDWSGGRDESWARAVASQFERTYAFPSINLSVSLTVKVPRLKAKDELLSVTDKHFSGTGMLVWEASFMLAEFLSRHSNFA